MAAYRVDSLPDSPLAAAALFHARDVPRIEAQRAASPSPSLTLVFPRADITHHGWRLAAVQSLARALAPVRVNGIAPGGAGDEDAAIAATVAWLEAAPGVTGQYWPLDAHAAACA